MGLHWDIGLYRDNGKMESTVVYSGSFQRGYVGI